MLHALDLEKSRRNISHTPEKKEHPADGLVVRYTFEVKDVLFDTNTETLCDRDKTSTKKCEDSSSSHFLFDQYNALKCTMHQTDFIKISHVFFKSF